MADFVIQVGSCSAQGKRPNNEDNFMADPGKRVYLVADGMGGQECGERASGMAVEMIPQLVRDRLASGGNISAAMKEALAEANKAIIDAGQQQSPGRRMGTTAVLAVHEQNQVFVAGLGDSRAYLIRGDRVEQLTEDHTVADALVRAGTLSLEQAEHSPWKHVLYKFLGCAEMTEGAEVRPFFPEPGDRLLMATDGLTNHIQYEDMRDSATTYPDPQEWAKYLIELALERGSQDNVTCVVVDFQPER